MGTVEGGTPVPILGTQSVPKGQYSVLKDKKKYVERNAASRRQFIANIEYYGDFLATYFTLGDWFVTITFRDRPTNMDVPAMRPTIIPADVHRFVAGSLPPGPRQCAPDPRLLNWEPDSRFRRDPGPPVRDAALREVEHWLFELGWEAAGRSRQEVFEWLCNLYPDQSRRTLARKLAHRCLFCALIRLRIFDDRLQVVRTIATRAIGWVIAEEFGRLGGRWHVHLLVRGVTHLRRRRWWRRAFKRFGRARIEPIHE
jgi:hypothetical protein